jgi:hypothetical protein
MQVIALALLGVHARQTAVGRRSMLSQCAGALTAGAIVGSRVDRACASWLSSEPLEQFRKLEQEAADASYGELAPINDGRGGGQRLVAILRIGARLDALASASAEPSRWSAIAFELAGAQFETKQLKRDFNLYSDNIYYSDENRANIYLLGGTTPETAQTEQYLLRNEVITAVQNARTEVEYLLKERARADGDTDPTDLTDYFQTARAALAAYMQKAEPRDVTVATKLFSAMPI